MIVEAEKLQARKRGEASTFRQNTGSLKTQVAWLLSRGPAEKLE
jgi:hypothetical protein